MVHSGYEASAVDYTFGSLKGLLVTARAMFFGKYEDPAAAAALDKHFKHPAAGPLVQIQSKSKDEVKV
jgi:hypothetical protein